MRMLRLQNYSWWNRDFTPSLLRFQSLLCFSATESKSDQGWGLGGSRREEAEGCVHADSYLRNSVPGGTQTVPETPQTFSNPGKMVCSLGWHVQCGGCKSKVIETNPPPVQDTLCWSRNIKKSQVEEPLEISETHCSFELLGDSATQAWVHPQRFRFHRIWVGPGHLDFPSSPVHLNAPTQ